MGYPHVSKHILEKRRFVESLTPGMEVSDLFLIAVAQQAQAKNGPYWRLEFRDAHGSISGKIWSPQSQNYPEITPGIALVTGRVTSYRDQPEIAVDSIRPLTAEESAGLDLSLFMPAAARSPHDMLEDLGRLAVGALSHEPWKRFVAAVLADPEIARSLPTAPAAKAMHHAYVGGLLEHTLSVCGLCMRLCDHYPVLDRQTLFAGALCHDLGKIWELSSGLVADYTTQGRLIGHMSIALEHLAPLMREAGLEPEYAEHLCHLILSHHGTREFGSPVLPATAEALALHYADNVDAKLNQIAATLNAALGEAETGWSAYVPALERTLYRAPKSPERESATEAEPDFEFGPLLYDDRLCEEFDPNFHLNDVSDFPEFLFDDSDTLPEKTFLPAETSSKSQTTTSSTSTKPEESPPLTGEAAAPPAPKADEPAPSPLPTEAQASDTTDSGTEAATSAPSAAQPEEGQVEASLSSDTAKPVEASASVTDEPAAEAAPVAETEPAASPVEAVANLSKTAAAPEKISSLEAAEIPEHSSSSASDPTDATPQDASAIPVAPRDAQSSETGTEPSAAPLEAQASDSGAEPSAAASEAAPVPTESDTPAQASPEAESPEAPPAPKKKRAPRGSRAKAAAAASAPVDEEKPAEPVSSDAQPGEAPSSKAPSPEMQADSVLSSDVAASTAAPSESSPSQEAPAPAGAQADVPASSEPGEDPAASPAPKKKKAAPKIESLSLLG